MRRRRRRRIESTTRIGRSFALFVPALFSFRVSLLNHPTEDEMEKKREREREEEREA